MAEKEILAAASEEQVRCQCHSQPAGGNTEPLASRLFVKPLALCFFSVFFSLVAIPVSSFVNMPHPPLFYNQACCPTLEPKVLQLDNKISDLKSLILVNTHFKVHSWLAKMLTVKHI